MNNCVLTAEVTQPPQVRYTQDNQTPIAEMMVQIPALREGNPPSPLKVLGWGNMASVVQDQCQPGDQVILMGRLRMTMVPRPEGFKDKVAELSVSQVQVISRGGMAMAPAPMATPGTPPMATPTPYGAPASVPAAPYGAPPAPGYGAPVPTPVATPAPVTPGYGAPVPTPAPMAPQPAPMAVPQPAPMATPVTPPPQPAPMPAPDYDDIPF